MSINILNSFKSVPDFYQANHFIQEPEECIANYVYLDIENKRQADKNCFAQEKSTAKVIHSLASDNNYYKIVTQIN